ncbi:MAG: 7-cyano-7-deazaguanine synthase [Bacteriovoracaceae bacterium]|nr:7-cyano-7-deazaguanine synthase [Bacteriovoracaceae bacterium]
MNDPIELQFKDYANSFHFINPYENKIFTSKKDAFKSAWRHGGTDFSFVCNFPQIDPDFYHPLSFRKMLEEVLSEVDQLFIGKRPVVLYSGGIDSEVILFAAHQLGLRPRAVFVNVMGRNQDELYWAQKFCQREGIDLDVVNLTSEFYMTSWLKTEYDLLHNISPGSFSSFGLNSVDPSTEYALFGSHMPQVLWCETDQSFYHMSRETDRVERQIYAEHLGVSTAFPYQFGRLWYTLANHLALGGRDLFSLKFRSEMNEKECLFMRGDESGRALIRQKELLYKSFPELSERPKMTAHYHLKEISTFETSLKRSKYFAQEWSNFELLEAPISLRPRHFYQQVTSVSSKEKSSYFWDLIPSAMKFKRRK